MKINKKMIDSLENALLINGDSLSELSKMEENILDACVIDPPYGINFLGKEWDNFSPKGVYRKSAEPACIRTGTCDSKLQEARAYQDWCYSWAKEVLRVVKHGGHLLSFCSTRMYHRLVVALQEAGWEIRDTISWIYGSGFPKSHNVGNSVDKLMGCSNRGHAVCTASSHHPTTGKKLANGKKLPKYKARTDEGKEWDGWGTALKPAQELIVLARKPLSEKTVAKNVLKWRTGGLNIDACRIDYNGEKINIGGRASHGRGDGYGFKPLGEDVQPNATGRFPANVILDEEAGNMLDQQSGIRKGWSGQNHNTFNPYGGNSLQKSTTTRKGYHQGYNDKGGASRFFYCPKPSKKEKNAGLEDLPKVKRDTRDKRAAGIMSEKGVQPQQNSHPTIKPVTLMRYLCRLVTPPNGVVLDCFMGSGSCGIAAHEEGFKYVGIEMQEDYFEIAKKRIQHTVNIEKAA